MTGDYPRSQFYYERDDSMMSNYFDYISESIETQISTYDDVHFIYNEMDVVVCEFDSYVQEGVGVKILIGIGIAAALGGLIALIIKLFSGNSSGSSASTKTKAAKSATTKAKKAGVKTVKVKVATGEPNAPKQTTSAAQSVDKAEEHVEEIIETVNQYNNFVEKYFDLLVKEIEKLMGKYPIKGKNDDYSDEERAKMTKDFKRLGLKLLYEAASDFPVINKLLGVKSAGAAVLSAGKIMKGDSKTIAKAAEGVLSYVASELNIDDVVKFVDSTMKQCRTLLFDGKELSKNGERLKALIKKSDGDKADETLQKLTPEKFDELTATVSSKIKEAHQFISQNMTAITNACNAALNSLRNGGGIAEIITDDSIRSIINAASDKFGEDIENIKGFAGNMMS